MHAICDIQGRPLNLFVTTGQVSDYIGARALCDRLPDVDWLLGGRGYDADWFREALQDKGIPACIPGRKQRKTPVKYDKRRYKRRNRPSRDIAPQCTAGQRSRSCSAGSRTGGGWPRDTTGAPRSSSRPSLSPLSSSTGYGS
ncbi:transposase [Pseudooceanicola sp. HF7]|nr:transposase [Pseudooceanicola sp. HF7]